MKSLCDNVSKEHRLAKNGRLGPGYSLGSEDKISSDVGVYEP